MDNDSRTRMDSVARSDEKETIQKISEVILDSRDILEKKAPTQDEAEVAFDRIAGCIVRIHLFQYKNANDMV